MRWRRKRTGPTFSELLRIEKILEGDPAVRRRLGRKTTLVRKRTGERTWFAAEVLAVAQAMMTQRLGPERAHVRKVLGVAVKVLGTGCPGVRGQTVTVLIGNSEATYGAAFRLMIEKLCKPSKRCEFTVVHRLEDVLAEAERHRFDLGIVILNNLQVAEVGTRNRIDRTLAAIAELKVRNPMPLIAISGYADGPDFEARVRQAGADEFMLLPLDWETCRDALTRCLQRSGVAPHWQ